MLVKNVNIIFLDKVEKGDILINEGKIKSINPDSYELDDNIIDGTGLYLSPGFIDVHIHGAGGYDTMNGTYESLNEIAKNIVKHGTTSFTPTTMTVAIKDIYKSMEAISKAKEIGTEGANVLGAHLEGPFISPQAIGAQNPNFLQKPSKKTYHDMVGEYENAVTSITIAPEIEGALELISYLDSKGVRVSLGHTKATYEEAMDGIKHGVSHATHLFNAMTPFHHREAGTVGAIFDSNITTETISDGIHISFPSLRTAYKIKTTDKVLLVTDAMEACCMPEGSYSLGGQPVIVKNGAARLENGALAGSILTLDNAIKNVYKNTNYPLHEVIKMATYNPAKHCKVDDKKGIIKEGYDADLVLFDDNIEIKYSIIGGKIVYSNN